MKDVLRSDFKTELSHELPYPDLSVVFRDTPFDYLNGTVEGERPNGTHSREGKDYLWFSYGDKPILSHRFIAAVTLGKWAPREFHVDHINHDPSDNRPLNLRVVTPRGNARNRREALLSELADFNEVELALEAIAKLKEQDAQDQQDNEQPPHFEVFGEPEFNEGP